MKKEKIYVCKKRKIFSRLLLSGGGLLIFAFVKKEDYGLRKRTYQDHAAVSGMWRQNQLWKTGQEVLQ